MQGVSIITSTIKPQFIDNIFENYDRQNWEEKELIVILNKDVMKIKEWEMKAKGYKNVSVYQLPEDVTLGECLNFGIEKARYPYVAKFDDDDYYAPEYLSQAVEALQKTDAVLVGKRTVYLYFQNEKLLTLGLHRIVENRYVKTMMRGGTLVFDKKIYPQIKFPPKNLGEDNDIQRQCTKQGLKRYTTDRKNYAYMRYDEKTHTGYKKNKSLIERTQFVAKTNDFKKYVDSNQNDD